MTVVEPIASVIIPSYRRPAQLARAVQSVLDDKGQKVEVIVVDDASPDGPPSPDDLGTDVRLIVRETNGGVAAAQNSGLEAATGRFVAFLHSDDEWLAGRLKRQISMLDGTHLAGVESPTIRASGSGEQLASPRLAGKNGEQLLAREVRDLHISGWLFRRHALTEIGGFDEELRCYEDLDLLVRLTRRFDITTENGAPVARIHMGGADRLGTSPWMRHGRLHLVRKYVDELDGPEGLPDGWRDWCAQVAVDLLQDPEADRREVVDLIRRVGRERLGRSIKALDLTVAARLPTPIGSKIAALRQRAWRR